MEGLEVKDRTEKKCDPGCVTENLAVIPHYSRLTHLFSLTSEQTLSREVAKGVSYCKKCCYNL